CFSAFQLVHAPPSTTSSTAIPTLSPSATVPFSLLINSACCSCKRSNSSSTSSSVTVVSCSSTSNPLYSPRETSGFTVTLALKTRSSPLAICSISTSGCATGSMPVSSTALT